MPRGLPLILATLALVGLTAGVAGARTCEIALHLDDAVTLGGLQIDVDYSAAGGVLVGSPNTDDCVGDAVNTLAGFQDHPASTKLSTSFLSLVGIMGPTALAHCHFVEGSHTIEASDFKLSIVDASNLDGKPVVTPKVSLSLPDCGPATTTSTTSTTTSTTTTTTTSTSTTSTTTVPLPYCGNGVVDGTEDCDDGNNVSGDGCEADCTSAILCGDASGNDKVQTSDALLILRAAVGLPVPCPLDLCDADGDAKVRAADSLRVLKRAVGQSVVMDCPRGSQDVPGRTATPQAGAAGRQDAQMP